VGTGGGLSPETVFTFPDEDGVASEVPGCAVPALVAGICPLDAGGTCGEPAGPLAAIVGGCVGVEVGSLREANDTGFGGDD